MKRFLFGLMLLGPVFVVSYIVGDRLAAQPVGPTPGVLQGAQSGSCTAPVPGYLNTTTGALVSCQSGTWTSVGGGTCSGDINSGCSQVTNLSNVSNASLANTGLAHSTMTLAGHSVALGSSQTFACSDLSNSSGGCSMSTTAGGDLSGTLPNPTVTNLSNVTNASLANTGLVNSSLTVAGHLISLGGTQTIACADLSNGASGCSTSAPSAAPPYIVLGGTKYVAATMATATLPPCSGSSCTGFSYLSTQTLNSIASQTNGDALFTSTTATASYYGKSASSSIQAEWSVYGLPLTTNISAPALSAIWLCDSTNGFVYTLGTETNGAGTMRIVYSKETSASCTTNPGTASVLAEGGYVPGQVIDAKLSVSGSTLTVGFSLNAGVSYTTLTSTGLGTISKAGIVLASQTNLTTAMDLYSLVVN